MYKLALNFFKKTAALLIICSSLAAAQREVPLNILIVTGGKDFDSENFYKIFEESDNIIYDIASKPDVFETFNSDNVDKYRAVVFYDVYKTTSEYEKKAFLQLLEKGIGCLFLHHAITSHQEWDEYKNIAGGKYHYDVWIEEGKKYGPSTYKHDQDFTVKIIDPNHPITAGFEPFPIRDEIYLNVEINDDVHPLLAADNGESMKYIGWTNKYLNSDIVYIQLGHDSSAYINNNFRKLIYNSLQWLGRERE